MPWHIKSSPNGEISPKVVTLFNTSSGTKLHLEETLPEAVHMVDTRTLRPELAARVLGLEDARRNNSAGLEAPSHPREGDDGFAH